MKNINNVKLDLASNYTYAHQDSFTVTGNTKKKDFPGKLSPLSEGHSSLLSQRPGQFEGQFLKDFARSKIGLNGKSHLPDNKINQDVLKEFTQGLDEEHKAYLYTLHQGQAASATGFLIQNYAVKFKDENKTRNIAIQPTLVQQGTFHNKNNHQYNFQTKNMCFYTTSGPTHDPNYAYLIKDKKQIRVPYLEFILKKAVQL